ncbi:MAG: membrane dipeptidase [Arenicella sp.]
MIGISARSNRVMKLAVLVTISAVISACSGHHGNSLAHEDLSNSKQARIQKTHTSSLVLDAHADIVLSTTSHTYLAAGGESKVSPAKLKAGDVGAVVMSIAVGPGPRNSQGDAKARMVADEKLSAIQTLIAENTNQLVLSKSVAELKLAREKGLTSIILGLQNARILQGDVNALDQFYASGVRVFGLNHLGHNDFSDSSRPFYNSRTASYEPAQEHGGLSDLGVAAIQRINDLGGIVDISQMSAAASLQAISLSRAPVIASHSNARAITNVSRNLSDLEIDKIADAGGVIHVAAFGAYLVDLSDPKTLALIVKVRLQHGLPEAYSYPYELYWELPDTKAKRAFLTQMRSVIGPGSIDDMLVHIDYIIDRVGIDHVGIGNDFNHGSGIQDFTDAADSKNLTAALIEGGYSNADIDKIWGANFLRVMKNAEQLAK